MKPTFTLLVLVILLGFKNSSAQLVDSLTINTGYTNTTKDTVVLGQQDPNWKITKVSTTLTGSQNFLTLPAGSSIPYKAYTSSVWNVSTPPYTVTTPTQTHWLSYGPHRMNNANPGAEGDTHGHYITFERSFTLCHDDTILINMDIRCDNFLISAHVDTQQIIANQGVLNHFYTNPYQLKNSIHALKKGVHTLKVTVQNQGVPVTISNPNNPVGLNVLGNITSSSKSILDIENYPNYSCNDSGVTIETKTYRSFSFNLYPNPFNDYLEVKYDIQNTDTKANIVIYNLVGKKVHQQRISANSRSTRINTSTLPKGMYVCSLVIDGISVVTNKIVK